MKIGTHSGSFQADDVAAVAMLHLLYPDAEVVRTRDQAVLDTCDVVADVGGVYNPSKGRYDHHQRGRAGERNGVLYAAAGLIWKHYGFQIVTEADVAEMRAEMIDNEVSLLSEDQVHAVVARVDRHFVQPVDALDNGQTTHVTTAEFEGAIQLSLNGLVAGMNPCWHEPNSDWVFNRNFMSAVAVVQGFLRRAIVSAVGVIQAEALVREAIAEAPDPRVIMLPRFAPWGEVVQAEAPKALFIVFKDEAGTWMCQCVPAALGSFEKRLALPEPWAGLRDSELQEKTGVPDAVFCHPGRFIMGSKSLEGVLKMTALALQAV